MKTCSKCKVEKELINFYISKNTKDGHGYKCKNCIKQYYLDNKNYINQYNKDYKKNNKEYVKKYNKDYKINNKEYTEQYNKKYAKQYYLQNKENISKHNKQYYINNKENIKENQKKYCLNNKEILKKYRLDNKEIIKENQKQYRKNRRSIDLLFKLSCNIRTLIKNCIKKEGYSKKSKTFEILGCTYEEFKLHLESQFTESMTWDNQGQWHLDHIYPISRAVDEQHLIKLNHYTNFQPLWAEDNLKKGNKI